MKEKTDFQKNHFSAAGIESFQYPPLKDEGTIQALEIEKVRDHFDQMVATLIKEYVFLRSLEHQSDLKTFLNHFEKELIHYALQISSGVQKRAADLLQVKQTALFEKIKRYGLKPARCRKADGRKDLFGDMGRILLGLYTSRY